MNQTIIDCAAKTVVEIPHTEAEVTQKLQEEILDASIQQTFDTARANETTLRAQMENALVNLRAYRALSSPTAAQTAGAVKLLCGVAIAVIRVHLRKLDATD